MEMTGVWFQKGRRLDWPFFDETLIFSFLSSCLQKCQNVDYEAKNKNTIAINLSSASYYTIIDCQKHHGRNT
jgi:hypothetical protein